MKKVMLLSLLGGLFLFATVGCESFMLRKDYSKIEDVRTGESAFYTYIKDRLHDFWDIFGFKFQAGAGLLAHARGTKLAQVGLGFFDGDKYGFKGRELGYWHEWRGEFTIVGGLPVTFINTSKKIPLVCNEFLFDSCKEARTTDDRTDIDFYKYHDRDFWSVGVCAHVLCLGFDIDIRVCELCDFIFGIATIDYKKDDTKNYLRRKKHGLVKGKEEFQTESVEPPPSFPRLSGHAYRAR